MTRLTAIAKRLDAATPWKHGEWNEEQEEVLHEAPADLKYLLDRLSAAEAVVEDHRAILKYLEDFIHEWQLEKDVARLSAYDAFIAENGND